MSLTGVDRLDRSIGKVGAWLAGIDAGLGTRDRRLAYCVLQAWLSGLQDRFVPVASSWVTAGTVRTACPRAVRSMMA